MVSRPGEWLLTISDSGPRGRNDEQYDAFSYIGLAIAEYFTTQSDDELEEEEFDELWHDYHDQGRSHTIGY